MKRYIVFLVLAVLLVPLCLCAKAAAADFELSTSSIFAPGEEVTFMADTMDVPSLEFRLYRIDDPKAYFLDLSDPHYPTMKTERDTSGVAEMAGGVKRKAIRLFRSDYRSILTGDFRKEAIVALGLPHSSEPESPAPDSYDLFPVLEGYTLIDEWKEDLSYTKKNRWEYHDIPLDIEEEGVYLVEGIYQDMVAYTVVIVSSLGFVTKNSTEDNLIFVADRITGEPVGGVEVSVYGYEEKTPITSGRTDSDGIFYGVGDSVGNDMLLIFVQKGDSFSLADPYTWWWWGDSADRVYTYTDRPVYRPGHTVYFRSIVRKSEGDDLVAPGRDETCMVTITDSKGNEIYKETLTPNEFGSISGEMNLASEPPLGDYCIVVDYNDTNHYSYFSVEEYKKPEFEVTVSADKEFYIRGETIETNIEAKYYFGSPVAEGEVEYVVYRSVYERPWWWGYDWGWYFMDDDYYWTHEPMIVDDGTLLLDENGKASLSVDTSRYIDDPDEDYTFSVEARVTDLSRREVSASTAVRVARSSFSLTAVADRWVYKPGDIARITVTVQDFDNKGVGDVKVSLTVTEKKSHIGVVTHSEVLSGVSEPDGEVVFEYTVKDTGNLTFNAQAFDTLGNGTTAKETAYSYHHTWDYYDEGGYGEISIIPDKDTYEVGDTAHILIIAPVDEAYLLVTTESRTIHDASVLKVEGGSAMYDFVIEDRHTPNIFVTAAAIFNDELYTEENRVVIPPEHKFINVEIFSDKEFYEPRETGTFTIKTTDSDGKPVSTEISLGIVDAAIYAIKPEQVETIEKYFYALRPHLVETSSSLYFSFYGYAHRKNLLAALESKETTLADFKGESLVEPEIRRDFKDTMFWTPAVVTGSDGTATVEVTFPDNLTRWRATVRGITEKAEVGESLYRVISRKDVIVRIEAPRFFRKGDDLVISTIAHNYLDVEKSIRMTFEAEGLTLYNAEPVDVTVPKNGETRIDWKVKADDVGDAILTAKAMTDEVSDGMELTIPILPTGVREVRNEMGEIVDESGSLSMTVEKPANSIKNAAELSISVSPTLIHTALSAIPYLVGYPYGCNEQVMSRFLPSVMVSSVLSELGLSYPEIDDELPNYINDGLMVLYKRQHYDDGWGWYENDDTTPRMTAYVLYGLIEAARILPETDLGISVDENVIKRGTASLISQLDEIDSDLEKVYALYVLSSVNAVKPEWLDEMFEKRDKLTPIGKAMLLIAYENVGIEAKAAELYEMLLNDRIEEDGYVYWECKDGRFASWEWEANEMEATAYVVSVMARRDIDNPLIASALRWLIAHRTGAYWRSTKSSAVVIYAMTDYLSRTGELKPDYDITLDLNGETLLSLHVTEDNMLEELETIVIPDGSLKTGDNILTLTKEGPGSVYLASSFTYFVDEPDVQPLDEGFGIDRRYYLLERKKQGREIVYVKKPLDGPVNSGDEILVELDVDTDSSCEYFLLEDFFPAGCEVIVDDENYIIEGDDYYDGENWYWYWYAGREFRDDRAGMSLSYMYSDGYTFKYIMRAEIPGRYSVMPAEAYLMYYPNKYGRTASDDFIINDVE
ncbi:MAG: hypothetical protein JW885_11305 [Deltaproteobacteria bacterium]|nr:hypothetical protein [Candidatus Zymogenaceae bacterium]